MHSRMNLVGKGLVVVMLVLFSAWLLLSLLGRTAVGGPGGPGIGPGDQNERNAEFAGRSETKSTTAA